jgi:CNT family concentrative nucleoside transporter
MTHRHRTALLAVAAFFVSSSTAFADAPAVPSSSIGQRAQSLFGLGAFCVIAFLIGRLRGAKTIPWRVVIWGLILQIAFGAMIVYSPNFLKKIQDVIQSLLDYSKAGAALMFGDALVNGAAPVTANGQIVGSASMGFALAITILATIIFVSMLTAILYHLGILTFIVNGLAWIMRKTMGTSGAETLSTAANIFVGQTEAPLFVKPFLATATNSELMAVMVGGFANIASGVLGVYTDLLEKYIQNIGGHLAAACFISAPATLVVAKQMMPEVSEPVTAH